MLVASSPPVESPKIATPFPDMLKNRARHVQYFERCLMQQLPSEYTSMDTSRMTLIFFCLSALDLLDALDEGCLSEEQRNSVIDWIYSQQIASDVGGGFRGGGCLGSQEPANLAMTYTALCSLLILGDDLSRVNKSALAASLKHLQQEDGSFVSSYGSTEADMRFLYCACCVAYILNDFSGVDVGRACDYIRRSVSYDGALGQGPNLESHGGSTFCGLAALSLMKVEPSTVLNIGKLKRWLAFRQITGFQGRINKDPDTCYSFWIGASLKMVNGCDLIDRDRLFSFLSVTETKYGGFGKEPDDFPDVLHSYMGLAGFSIFGAGDIAGLFVPLNISDRAVKHLEMLLIK